MRVTSLLRLAAALIISLVVSAALAAEAPPLPPSPTALFTSERDREPGERVATDDPLSLTTWRVGVAVVDVARKPRLLRVPLGTRLQAIDIPVDRFEPREGFSVDDRTGELIVADDPRKVSYYWYGRRGATHLALTVQRGVVQGIVYAPTFRFTLDAIGSEHRFRDVDRLYLATARCRNDEIGRNIAVDPRVRYNDMLDRAKGWSPKAPAAPKSGQAAWSGTPIAIKFYYTDQAALLVDPPRPAIPPNPPYPGYDPISNPGPAIAILRTRATAYVDELRQSFVNSGGLFHIRPAQAADVTRLTNIDGSPFAETGIGDPGLRFGNYLLNFQLIDKVSAGRLTANADLAVLLVADVGDAGDPLYGAAYTQRPDCGDFAGPPALEPCGMGVLPPPLLPGQRSYRDWGQAVVSINPGSAGLTFSHEVGHMLGNAHDPPFYALPPPFQSFAHSYGYRTGGFRDIMADPPCPNDICPRGWQYSNPEVFIIGTALPAGVAGGRACPDRDTCPAAPHAALTIRKLAAGVSNIYPLTSALEEPDLHWDGFEF